MKFRSTVFLLIVGAAMAAYLLFVERGTDNTREKLDKATHVVNFDRDKIDSISLRSPETKIELRRNDKGIWMMEEPAKDRADSVAVAQLLTTVDHLQSVSAVPVDPKKKEELKEFGVVESTTKAKFNGGGKTVELILGKDAGSDGKCYVYVDGAPVVHAVEVALKTQLQKRGEDFRDRKLANFGPTQVTKAEIKSPAGVLELTRTNEHWSITKPLKARGDDSYINDLLAQGLNAHVEEFGSEVNLATSGVSEPRGTVTFTQEGVEKPVVLSIGGNPKEEKDKEKTWAKLSTRDALVLVPKTIERLLAATPNDLRDRNLLRVETDIVDHLIIESPQGGKFLMARNLENWIGKVGDKEVPINAALPPRIMSDLQAVQVTDYVADVATDLASYGLDQPTLTVTFSSYSKENNAEDNAGEKPIVAVQFGKIEGSNVYAKLDDEPFIVLVSAGVFDKLPKTPVELQDLGIFNDQVEEVTALDVMQAGRPPLRLEKDKDMKWSVTKGDGKIDSNALSAFIYTFTHLGAARWAGPTKPEDGFDQPTAVLVATLTKGGQKVTRKLTIGTGAGNLWKGAAEGHEGTFLIGKPDHDMLALPLTDQPVPAPPAAAPVTPSPPPVPAPPAEEATPKPTAPAAPAPELPVK